MFTSPIYPAGAWVCGHAWTDTDLGASPGCRKTRVLLPLVRDPAPLRGTRYPWRCCFVQLHLCLRLFPGRPKAGVGPWDLCLCCVHSGGGDGEQFLSSGSRIHNPGEPRGVLPASGGIHVGTSVFSQKPDPRPLPSPTQPMASFSFLFLFFKRKQLWFRFYPQTFLKPLSKLAECTGHLEASTTSQDKLRFLKSSLFSGPFFSGGRWGGVESLQKLETRAPYAREGLSSGQTAPLRSPNLAPAETQM